MRELLRQGLLDGGLFLNGSAGPLFVRLVGDAQQFPMRWLLIIPPFAEEMNKSRRMFSLLAQQLAGQNMGVLLPDFYGTGDSYGDFADARVEIWRDDCASLIELLHAAGVTGINLLGARSGALLAAELCGQKSRIENLLLWQPVVKGRLFMKQFLRLRMAADLMRTDSAGLGIEESFAEQGGVEVAGYWLSKEFYQSFVELNINTHVQVSGRVAWYELSTQSEAKLTLPARQTIECWRTSGLVLDDAVLMGEAFWSTTEITVSDTLLARSCSFLHGAGM